MHGNEKAYLKGKGTKGINYQCRDQALLSSDGDILQPRTQEN
jgi:hypothetical protein